MERTNNTKKIHSNKRFFLVYEFEVTSIVMIDTVITYDTVPFSRERYICFKHRGDRSRECRQDY